MKKYFIIKNIPDANIGTEVIWGEDLGLYYYLKNSSDTTHYKNYLTLDQVVNNKEYFCVEDYYAVDFAYKNPVYSREEILTLLKESFPDKKISGSFEISAAKQLYNFEMKLRVLGRLNAEKIINTLKKQNNE